MARSIRGAVTEENLKSVGRERRSGGWGLEEGGEWIRSRGGSLEGGAAGREDRRLWQQVSPPWKAAIFRFVRAFRKTFAFLPREEERKASLFFSFPLSSPPFLLFSSPRVSTVFFSSPSSSSPSSPPLFSSPSFSLSLSPLGSAWMNEKRIRFCVLRETGFFPTLNYKTALQLFFPGARYFSFFRSL